MLITKVPLHITNDEAGVLGNLHITDDIAEQIVAATKLPGKFAAHEANTLQRLASLEQHVNTLVLSAEADGVHAIEQIRSKLAHPRRRRGGRMNFKLESRVWINCDGCGESFGEDLGIPSDPLSKAQLKLRARNNGYVLTAGKQFCPMCFKKLSEVSGVEVES